MIFLRLGMTESTLLFLHYLDKNGFDDINDVTKQHVMLNWLFTTSGFYDKEIKGNFFNFDSHEILNKSRVYQTYFDKLLEFIQLPDVFVEFNYHKINPWLCDIRDNQFRELFKVCESPPSLFEFMANKNVIIINSLSPLMKEQFDTGNVFKAVPEFPQNISSIHCVQCGYTFFNSGPDNNILETCDSIFYEVMQKQDLFDAIIISVGAYSSLLTQKLSGLELPIHVIGGLLPMHFGIATKRCLAKNEYFITVPDSYKPPNHHLIEDGCYW